LKAVILIAGEGSRLKPLTDYIPKCCMPIAGVPLLHIWIKKLLEAGVGEILLNPCGVTQEVMESIFSLKLHINPIHIVPERKPLGTAGTLWKNREWLQDDDFIVIYGDVLTNLSLEKLISVHGHCWDGLMTAATYRTDRPKQKGILEMICHSHSYHVDAQGWAVSFHEKPENPESELAFAGIAIAKPELLSHITKKDFDLTGDVLTRIVNDVDERIWVYYDPKWYFKDIGTIPDYLACQSEWRQLDG